uniref:TIMELESS-interacting protein n=1 Tax=Cacopsylla melanoneura TaxID=428564 RepID=A0A8D8TC35_9HEMI
MLKQASNSTLTQLNHLYYRYLSSPWFDSNSLVQHPLTMAMLDEIFMEELVDDPEPLLTEDPRMEPDQDDEDENSEQPPLNPSEPSADAERVAPKKKVVRNQQPKLNPQRLTGPRGIQCIEQYFKNVKFKGKGHELHDLNTIMGNLEHWANRLYPKANFDDVLKKLEVLGHKRPVMTHIKKIRLDMISEPEQDSNLVLSDNETSEQQPTTRTADDIFDELLTDRPARPPPAVREPTAEQRERMKRNRQLAEQKRQQRLAAEMEKEATLANIEFQNALLESEGERREAILETGEVEKEPVSDNTPEASETNAVKASESNLNDIPTDTEMKELTSRTEVNNGNAPLETISKETFANDKTDGATEAQTSENSKETNDNNEGPIKKPKMDSETHKDTESHAPLNTLTSSSKSGVDEDVSELVKDIGDDFFEMEDDPMGE